MAQPGEFFPQQFALGVLNIFNSVKQKQAELQEMRRERAARNLLEQNRLDLVGRGLAIQQAENEQRNAQNEAALKFEYDKLNEARIAARQDAMTKFAAGQPTFFPVGTPIPPAPTVKDTEGKEIPAFEYTDHVIPGYGTFVIPRNKLTDQLGLQKLKQDLDESQIKQVGEMMDAQARAAQAEHWMQQVRNMRNWKVDPDQIKLAQQFNIQMLQRLQSYNQVWGLLSDKAQEDFGGNPLNGFKNYVGEDNYQIWLDAQALLKERYADRGNTNTDVPNGPMDLFDRFSQMKLFNGITRGLQPAGPKAPSGLPSPYEVPPGEGTITQGISLDEARTKYGDFALTDVMADISAGRTPDTRTSVRDARVRNEPLQEKTFYDTKAKAYRTELFWGGKRIAEADNTVQTAPVPSTAPVLRINQPVGAKTGATPPPAFNRYPNLTDEENNFLLEMHALGAKGDKPTPDEQARINALMDKAAR